jgi:hypothetical protein
MNCSKPTVYCTCQFQTIAQPSNTAAHLTGNVKLTETLEQDINTTDLRTRELLVSRPGHFIAREDGNDVLSTRLRGLQIQSLRGQQTHPFTGIRTLESSSQEPLP